MQIRSRSYPHPVLSYFNDDIVDSQFQMTPAITTTKTSYRFDVLAKVSNDDLVSLIADGKAHYGVHVECPSTRYRQLFSRQEDHYEFDIPASAIDGSVDVCSLILAMEDLPQYRNRNFHPDYQGRAFNVRKGDVLAVAPDLHFFADKRIDPLRKIPSIFVIVPAEAKDAPPMEVGMEGDKIRISLARPNYDAWTYLIQAQPLHSTLNSMVIIPALVYVLDAIKGAAKESDLLAFESRRWYAVLSRRLRQLGIDPEDADSFADSTPALAHLVIGQPITDALKTLREYEEPADE